MYGSDTYPMTEPWACWRCNRQHARRHARCHARCPNAGVNEGAASYQQRMERMETFLARLPEALANRIRNA